MGKEQIAKRGIANFILSALILAHVLLLAHARALSYTLQVHLLPIRDAQEENA